MLRHSGRRHAMRLDATPPPAWGSRFSLRGDFRQPQLWTRSGEWQSWGGQVYAEFPWVDLAQLRLLIQQNFKAQTQHTQLRHFGIELLGCWHFRKTGNLGAQGFTKQVRCAKPLRLLAQRIQRLTYL